MRAVSSFRWGGLIDLLTFSKRLGTYQTYCSES